MVNKKQAEFTGNHSFNRKKPLLKGWQTDD